MLQTHMYVYVCVCVALQGLIEVLTVVAAGVGAGATTIVKFLFGYAAFRIVTMSFTVVL